MLIEDTKNSIEFRNLTKGFWLRGNFKYVLDDVTFSLPKGKKTALLGLNGAGKSTLLKIISGTMKPTSGKVHRQGRVSWPVGFKGGFHKDLTGRQNTMFVARAYRIDTDNLVEFVRDFAEVGEYFDVPLRNYSSGMKSRLAFGISMGVPFDIYLVDEVTAVGDVRFKKKSRTVFKAQTKNATALMVSHSLTELKKFCSSGLILHQGKLEFIDNIDDAVDHYSELTK